MSLIKLITLTFLLFANVQKETTPVFSDGISQFEENKWDKAEQTFEELLKENPDNPTLLYNLGRVHYEKGHLGLALGLWRKARSIDPQLEEVDMAIRFAEEKHFPEKNTPPVYLVFFNSLLEVSLHIWLGISVVFLLIWGWEAVEYGVKRHLSITHWPSWLHLCLPVLLITLIFVSIISMKRFTEKATIVSPDLQTRISPSETSPTLSELYEGQVVNVEKILDDWAQIRLTSGAPGWVPKSSIIIFGEQ